MSLLAPKAESSRAALLALIAVNLIPLVGVLHWGWSVFEIVFVYWCENLIIGFITVLKMMTAFPADKRGRKHPDDTLTNPIAIAVLDGGSILLGKLFLIGFFIVHYGMFCAGHGTFIFAIFSEGAFGNSETLAISQLLSPPIAIVCGALLISHLCSYVTNYLGRGEFRQTTTKRLMGSPYQRIIVLQITIIGGAGLTLYFGEPLWLLSLLVALKLIADVSAHMKERARFDGAGALREPPASVISNLAANGLKSRPS